MDLERQMQLFGSEVTEGQQRCWRTEQGLGAQQDDKVSQQAHDPSELEGIEKEAAESELMFFEGLRGLDPRADAVIKMSRQPGVVGNQPKKNLVVGRGIGELTRAPTLLPAPGTKLLRRGGAEPLLLAFAIIMEPLQALALRTTGDAVGDIGLDQMHVLFEAGNDGHSQFFADAALDL